MADYKIVASDLDQTFLNDSHEIPQANVEGIRRLRQMGCLFVPASGRSYKSIMRTFRHLPPELLEGSYVISYNGGCVNRVGQDQPLVSHRLPFERARALFAYGQERGLCMHVYTVTGDLWIYNMVPKEHDYLEGFEVYDLRSDRTLDFARDIPLIKVLYVIPGDLEGLHALREGMPRDITDGTETTYSSQRYLEFIPQGISKGGGLSDLADYLGLDLAQTIACGDAENDVQMLRTAGVGVAVATADPAAAAAADYQTKTGYDQGILPEVIERFLS